MRDEPEGRCGAVGFRPLRFALSLFLNTFCVYGISPFFLSKQRRIVCLKSLHNSVLKFFTSAGLKSHCGGKNESLHNMALSFLTSIHVEICFTFRVLSEVDR